MVLENTRGDRAYSRAENKKNPRVFSKGEDSINLPSIFKEKIKNNLKLRPFNDMISDVGNIQYFPAWSKEWRNSVYYYNSNLMKNFPVYDINIFKIIKGYFNIYFKPEFLKYRHLLNRKRRLSYNKIFFARPEIKHTNSKGIVTLYTFNREKIALSERMNFLIYLIWELSSSLRSGRYSVLYLLFKKKIINSEWLQIYNYFEPEIKKKVLREFKAKYGFKNNVPGGLEYKYMQAVKLAMRRKLYWLFSNEPILTEFLRVHKLSSSAVKQWILTKPKVTKFKKEKKDMGFLNKLERMFFRFHFIFVLMKDLNLLQDFYAYFSALKASKIKGKELANKWVKILWRSEIIILRKYKFKLNLNKYKFEEKFLGLLSNILGKIYSKQIEFNIVNLKNIVFNTDLFTEISTKKIHKRNTRVSKVMESMLTKAKLPIVNRIKEKGRIVKNVNYNLIENKYRTMDLKNILHGELHLDKLLNNTYSYFGTVFSSYKSLIPYPELGARLCLHNPLSLRDSGIRDYVGIPLNNIQCSGDKGFRDNLKKIQSPLGSRKNKIYPLRLTQLYNLVFNSIKYKNLGGIRMEVKGRLTPRYRADRSVYKLRWKGGLRDIASSYKGLPVQKNRGHLNPNVSYSILSSKRRVGAFAVKGWTGAKYYSTSCGQRIF